MRHRRFDCGGFAGRRRLTSGWRRCRAPVRHRAATTTFKVPASTYTPPKTPWGDPDLQGVWDNHTAVPMQRPANLAGKKTFTDAELAARAKARATTNRCAIRTTSGAPRPRLPISTNQHLQRILDAAGLRVRQPDRAHRGSGGRAHPGDDAGGHRDTAGASPTAPAHGRRRRRPRDPPLGGLRPRRAVHRGTGATTTMGYNSAQYLMQSPGWVMLAHERLNTRIIPLDGRPHLGGTMGGWMGDSRGRWEGNTLVVETKSYTNKQSGGSVGAFAPEGSRSAIFTWSSASCPSPRTGSTTTSRSTTRRPGPGRGRSCSPGRRTACCAMTTTSAPSRPSRTRSTSTPVTKATTPWGTR